MKLHDYSGITIWGFSIKKLKLSTKFTLCLKFIFYSKRSMRTFSFKYNINPPTPFYLKVITHFGDL